jgi:hypothetical protein
MVAFVHLLLLPVVNMVEKEVLLCAAGRARRHNLSALMDTMITLFAAYLSMAQRYYIIILTLVVESPSLPISQLSPSPSLLTNSMQQTCDDFQAWADAESF